MYPSHSLLEVLFHPDCSKWDETGKKPRIDEMKRESAEGNSRPSVGERRDDMGPRGPVVPPGRRLEREQDIYDRARIDASSGELQDFDDILYPAIVRRMECEVIRGEVARTRSTRVLDVGCGAGWSTRFLSQLAPHVVGLDVSRKLVTSAHSASRRMADFLIADGNSLPMADKSFDLIVSVGALHHLDTEVALREWHRVLKPEGHLLLFEPNLLNPLAIVGRKFFRFDTHTPDERPFRPAELQDVLNRGGWELLSLSSRIHFTFALSRLVRLRLLPESFTGNLVSLIGASECALEKLPVINNFGWIIVATARPGRTSTAPESRTKVPKLRDVEERSSTEQK